MDSCSVQNNVKNAVYKSAADGGGGKIEKIKWRGTRLNVIGVL